MLNIFVHTVHHLDTRIPLYRLRAAQQALEAELGSVAPRWRFGWSGVRLCFALCKLWDAQAACWVGYPAAPGRARLSR